MAPIVSTLDVDRPAEEVFYYVIDPTHMPEWQAGVTSGHMDGTPVHVGSRCTTTRKIGGAQREVVTEITEYDPPRRWADHGINGPIRAVVSVRVDPLEGDARSRLVIEVDFEGHGIGKLLVPLIVRPQARREMPGNIRRLEQRLATSGESAG